MIRAAPAWSGVGEPKGRPIAITEESRYQLFQGLDETLGTERAATLMEHLPPVGWADVATKRDLDQSAVLTRTELRREMATLASELRSEISDLRAEFFREQRNQTLAIIGANTTIVALLFAAFRLL